jgi:8-amino-7-oxononanoate synthase
LSEKEKAAALALVRAATKRDVGGANTGAGERQGREAVPFSSLPAYAALQKQRAVADLLEISNPFYRCHAARAGATTDIDGRCLANFASYDYLGLNGHRQVTAAAEAALERYGTSASASRMVAGERPVHRELERALASLYAADDAVVFVSGHATNVSTLATLLGPEDLIVYDTLVHNSVVVGAALSGAQRRSVPHNDLVALEAMLAETRTRYRHCLIVVEGVYSMDGDCPDLPALVAIKRRHQAWLMVDEAHALGVLGAKGHGLAEHWSIEPGAVDIWMGTLSKTLAGCGGYVAGSTALIELLKFQAPGFVYSVGLPPPIAAASLAALEIMAREPERVARLQSNGRFALERARQLGLDTGYGMGYGVLPLMIGDAIRAGMLTQRLFDRGINVLPILYPAVPMQSARLRLFLTAEHTHDKINEALLAVAEELEGLDRVAFDIAALANLIAEEDSRRG